jgi:hypothetical protein
MASLDRLALQKYILQLDDQSRTKIRGSFANFSLFLKYPDATQALADEVREIFATKRADSASLAKRVGVEESMASDAQTVAAFLTGLAGATESDAELIEAAIESDVLPKEAVESVRTFLPSLRRQDLKRELDEVQLADSTLPSFDHLYSSVDVRLRFTGDGVEFAVPVIVAGLFTDSKEQRIWFQLNKAQAVQLVKTLEERLHQMELANRWIRARGEDSKK